jgi:hypothetical protein
MRRSITPFFTKPLSAPGCTDVSPGAIMAAGLAAVLVLAGCAAGIWWWTARTEPTPTKTCYGIIWVPVDFSDPLDSPQLQQIKADLDAIPSQSCMGTRLLISQFNPSKAEPIRPLYDKVDPGRYGEHSIFTKSKIEVEDERRDSFLIPLRAQLERALIPDSRSQSMIVEGLTQFSRLPVFKGEDPDVSKKVILISDMLQNSPGCSVYKVLRQNVGKRRPTPLATGCARLLDDYKARLKGAEVEILFIRRPRTADGIDLQPTELREMFENWLRVAGARNVVWRDR